MIDNSTEMFFKKKKHFIQLDKNKFFEDIKTLHKSSLSLLEQFKIDFSTLSINLNGKNISSYSDILTFILDNYEHHLERILLLCNKSIFTKSMELIKERVSNDLHIIADNTDKTTIGITLHHLAKQIYLKNLFKLIKINSTSSVCYEKEVYVEIVVDISNSEPVLIILENLEN